MANFQTFNIQRLVDLFKLWSNFWPIFGTLWQNSNTTSTQLWNNFDRSFGQLWLFIRQFWDYIDKTLRRLWDDFETTLRQLWGTLWLLVDVTCHVGSILQLFRVFTLSSLSLKVKSTFHELVLIVKNDCMWYSFGIPDTFFCHGTSKQWLFPRFHQIWLVILYTFQVGLVLYKLAAVGCWDPCAHYLGSGQLLSTRAHYWAGQLGTWHLVNLALGTWSTWPHL